MKVKDALDLYKGMELSIKSIQKEGPEFLKRIYPTPEDLAFRTIVSAYLKQRLVIKQLQNQNKQLKKGVDQWNSFRSLI